MIIAPFDTIPNKRNKRSPCLIHDQLMRKLRSNVSPTPLNADDRNLPHLPSFFLDSNFGDKTIYCPYFSRAYIVAVLLVSFTGIPVRAGSEPAASNPERSQNTKTKGDKDSIVISHISHQRTHSLSHPRLRKLKLETSVLTSLLLLFLPRSDSCLPRGATLSPLLDLAACRLPLDLSRVPDPAKVAAQLHDTTSACDRKVRTDGGPQR